jgi:hypothetical protein
MNYLEFLWNSENNKTNHSFDLGRARRPDPTRSASAYLGPAAGPVEPIRSQAAKLLRRRRCSIGVRATANLMSRAYKGWVPWLSACPSHRLHRSSRPHPTLHRRSLCCSPLPEPQGMSLVAGSICRLRRPSGQTSTTSSFESTSRIQRAPRRPWRSTGATPPVHRPTRTAAAHTSTSVFRLDPLKFLVMFRSFPVSYKFSRKPIERSHLSHINPCFRSIREHYLICLEKLFC